MADLRDEKVIRASLLSQLIDLDGSDLKKVYEPFSNQIGYLLTFLIFIVLCHFAWKRYRRWQQETTPQFIPYKVLKPPSSMFLEQSTEKEGKKRVCAVVGATGFIGGHIVDGLVRRNKHFVFALGRKFKPERTNPDVDCLIRVDMLDLDGLVTAFQGVDSVISAAAVIPTVFHTADSVYSKNRLAFTNVLKAAQKAGVKNLVHLSGYRPKTKPKDPVFGAFLNAFLASEKDIVDANGEEGLRTTVIAPTNILGLNSAFFDRILAGEMTSSPQPDAMPNSFMPVEYLVAALLSAEEKLASPTSADALAGKVLPLRGEPMSWKTLFTQPSWPHKISDMSLYTMSAAIKVNVVCATLLGWAPFSAELCAGILELMGFTEEEVSEEEVQKVYEVLGVGPPHPPIADYIPQLVERYRAKTKDKKNK